ncbi:hypothetical protein TRICI_004931 [Trichomonascus ciferrii]|uniref:NADP-dependent oxidoreductase domain-containing protein n=1 Tax=Trichomonascus ciferrii TaxID=44093 RepID=A0A642UY10_9ASCO|nr:hypothetical protein TRICI_004931 [Trichomonascus ciferrii]
MATQDTTVLKLNNGVEIPALGLGTWQSTEQEGYDAVMAAIKAGYKHIDTAWLYGNEEVIGHAIKDSGVNREDLFITTKLWNCFHRDPVKNLDDSLTKLQLDYVDLYLMHFPTSFDPVAGNPFPNDEHGFDHDWNFLNTWELMQQLPKNKVKSIGVSNFSTMQLEELLNAPTTKELPVTNQVETHPYLPQNKLVEYCKAKNIVVEAYSPLGSTNSGIMDEPVIKQLAQKYSVSAAQILISWAIWRGTVVLPKSSTPSRITANLQTVKLSDEDGEAISSISTRKRFIPSPWPDNNLFHDGIDN